MSQNKSLFYFYFKLKETTACCCFAFIIFFFLFLFSFIFFSNNETRHDWCKSIKLETRFKSWCLKFYWGNTDNETTVAYVRVNYTWFQYKIKFLSVYGWRKEQYKDWGNFYRIRAFSLLYMKKEYKEDNVRTKFRKKMFWF